jgi:amino acid transporter
VPTISSPPLRHLPKRGPRLSKITVVYRTPNGATILQSISSPFSVITFFRLRHMNCSYVAGRICACR